MNGETRYQVVAYTKLGTQRRIWLTLDVGSYQWSTSALSARSFRTRKCARQAIQKCPGPWFNEPNKRTIKLIEGKYFPAIPARFEPKKPDPSG